MHERHTRREVLAGLGGLVLAGAARAADPSPIAPWPAGRAVPSLQLADLQGRPWALPLQGKAVALNFWASWCEPCRSELPSLQQLADFYADRLTVLALNFKERAATAQRFVQRGGFSLPVLLDPQGEAARRYEVKVFPTTILYGADGRPRWRVQGELDWTGKEALALVEGLWR
jgi:thiol-disulfide isomerase/thioredoxin